MPILLLGPALSSALLLRPVDLRRGNATTNIRVSVPGGVVLVPLIAAATVAKRYAEVDGSRWGVSLCADRLERVRGAPGRARLSISQ